MNLLAYGASNSRLSINKALVTYAAQLLQVQSENIEVEILDLNDFEMPIYSHEREQDHGIPDLAQQFYKKIGAADALMVSFAEHNGHYSAAYKNLFDWASRINVKVYQNKPAVIMSTSPGRGGANSVLTAAKASTPFFGMDIKADLSVPSFNDQFTLEDGQIVNAENAIREQLLQAVQSLV